MMALVTILGTWGSVGHRDMRLFSFGELLYEGLMLRASRSIVVGFSSPKDTSELVMLVGDVEVG